MSLEEQLAANTAALQALTAAVMATTKLAPAGGADKAEASKAEASKADKPAATEGKAGKGKAAADTKPATGLTAEQLTTVIVGAVKTHGKDKVLAVLKDDFGVGSGKEITDPAVREQAAAKIKALDDAEPDLG